MLGVCDRLYDEDDTLYRRDVSGQQEGVGPNRLGFTGDEVSLSRAATSVSMPTTPAEPVRA